MIDKNLNLTIIISATSLNIRFGKEPDTGTLSHSIVNQTEYFGFKATRLITSLLFNGVATTNSSRCSNWAGGFLLTKNGTSQERTAIQSPALTLVPPRKATMAIQDFSSFPLPDANSGNPESSLDSQLIQAQTQIETIQAAIIEQMMVLADWMTRFKALQEHANPFINFINNELEIEL